MISLSEPLSDPAKEDLVDFMNVAHCSMEAGKLCLGRVRLLGPSFGPSLPGFDLLELGTGSFGLFGPPSLKSITLFQNHLFSFF